MKFVSKEGKLWPKKTRAKRISITDIRKEVAKECLFLGETSRTKINDITRIYIKQLKEENEFLENKLTETKTQIMDLSEQNKVLKLAKSLSGKEGKSTEIKLRINELIREIDKCIAKVNS